MSLAAVTESPDASTLAEAFELQRSAFSAEPDPTYVVRRERLKALRKVLLQNKGRIVAAISDDFGNRSDIETLGAEILVTDAAIKYLMQHLKGWMQPESRHISMLFAPAKGEVRHQPLGVVGVISPWNYPLQLAFVPIATALAAGNRVLLKPSELTPRTSDLMAELLHQTFPRDLVSVHTGGVEVGAAFSRLPFDHLLYTGSTHVGRIVMKAAAENLTPVTLELGGKSPAIVHSEADMGVTIERIAFGKMLNAGQTCVACDYVLVPRNLEEKLVRGLEAQFAKFYPTIRDNPDLTSIVNERHHSRICALVEDAREKGATVTEVNPSSDNLEGSRKIAPTLIQNVNDEMRVMQDEIFGPVLPIVPYDTLEEAIAYVNARPRPLALYYFDGNRGRIERILASTHSGGVCINDATLHVGQDDLPFGGVGPSGMGAYHGKEGYLTFTHAKAVFYQRKVRFTQLFNPPYGQAVRRVLKLLVG